MAAAIALCLAVPTFAEDPDWSGTEPLTIDHAVTISEDTTVNRQVTFWNKDAVLTIAAGKEVVFNADLLFSSDTQVGGTLILEKGAVVTVADGKTLTLENASNLLNRGGTVNADIVIKDGPLNTTTLYNAGTVNGSIRASGIKAGIMNGVAGKEGIPIGGFPTISGNGLINGDVELYEGASYQSGVRFLEEPADGTLNGNLTLHDNSSVLTSMTGTGFPVYPVNSEINGNVTLEGQSSFVNGIASQSTINGNVIVRVDEDSDEISFFNGMDQDESMGAGTGTVKGTVTVESGKVAIAKDSPIEGLNWLGGSVALSEKATSEGGPSSLVEKLYVAPEVLQGAPSEVTDAVDTLKTHVQEKGGAVVNQPVDEADTPSGGSSRSSSGGKSRPDSDYVQWEEMRSKLKSAREGGSLSLNVSLLLRQWIPADFIRTIQDRDLTVTVRFKEGSIKLVGSELLPVERNRVFFPYHVLAELYG